MNAPLEADPTGAYLDLALSAGDGVKLAQIQFRNEQCFISDTYQVVIELDREAPVLRALRFQGGAITNQRDVVLIADILGADRFTVQGDVDEVASDAPQNGRVEISPMPRIPVKLTAGDGLKTVILTASDAAGNVTEGRLEAEIRSDTAAPDNPLIIINGGEESTENSIVRLNRAEVTTASLR